MALLLEEEASVHKNQAKSGFSEFRSTLSISLQLRSHKNRFSPPSLLSLPCGKALGSWSVYF